MRLFDSFFGTPPVFSVTQSLKASVIPTVGRPPPAPHARGSLLSAEKGLCRVGAIDAVCLSESFLDDSAACLACLFACCLLLVMIRDPLADERVGLFFLFVHFSHNSIELQPFFSALHETLEPQPEICDLLIQHAKNTCIYLYSSSIPW